MASRFPLDLYRSEMGIMPWHFWGLANSLIPTSAECDVALPAYSWQSNDAVSRKDLYDAVDSAVARLHEQLGFYPVPTWVDVQRPWPLYNDPIVERYPFIGPGYRWLRMKTDEGYIQQLGVESLVLINDTASIALTDRDGDGLKETFTITQATSVTDPILIALYFSSSDRFNSLEDSEITPINVAISGGIATITGSSWLLVHPVLYEGINAIGGLDPNTVGTFVTTAAVYQHSTYTAGTTPADSQCMLSYAAPVGTPLNAPGDVASVATSVARAGIVDAHLGLVTPVQEQWDPVNSVWNTVSPYSLMQVLTPTLVDIRMYAGYPLDSSGHVTKLISRLVSRFAAAELGRPINACKNANREVYRWQFDLARSSGSNDEAYGLVSKMDLENPFGTRRGHVYAWRVVQQLMLRPGSIV